MPTINKSFLLRLILVVLVGCGALVGLHQLQADRIPAALWRQAQRAEAEQRLDTAIHYYRQYLEFRNQDVEGQIRLAELLRRRSTSGRALAEVLFLYDRILNLEPGRHDIRREALATALRLGRYSDALVHAEQLLQIYPQDPLLWQQLGAAQAGLNRLTEARQCYEKAVELAPQELLGYQRLAQLLWRNLNDVAGARTTLEQMVAALPEDPNAHLTKARFEWYVQAEGPAGRPDTTLAIQHLYKVCELDPENLDAALLLAEIYQQRFRWDVAQYLLREARALYPRDLRVVRALSWLEVSRGNLPAAIAILEEGLRQIPEAQDLLIPLADLLIQQGDKVRTAAILQRLQQRSAASVPGRYLQIRLAMRDQKWSEALQQIETLQAEVQRSSALNTQLHLLRAICLEQTGDRSAAEKALQTVLLAEPHNGQALHALGQLYLDMGRFAEAARVWEQAASSPYASGATIAHWIRFQLHQLRGQPGKAEQWRRLEHALESAASRFAPASSEPIILMAELLRVQGRATEALRRLRQELGRRPMDVRLWVSLVETTAQLHGSTAALAVLDEAQATCGDLPELRLCRATLIVQEPGQLRPLTPLCQHTESWTDADQIRLWYGLLDVFELTQDTSQVLSILEQLAQRRPQEPTLWLRLCQKAIDAGQMDLAERALHILRQRQGPDGDQVLLAEAWRVTRETATACLHRLQERFGALPRSADAAVALARIYDCLQEREQTGRLLAHAFQSQPTHFAATSAWLCHLLKQSNFTEAQAVIERLRHDPRWGVLPIRQLIQTVVAAVPEHQRAETLRLLRPLVEFQTGGLSWLGELAVRWHIPDSSALLREAVQQPTATPDDWLRLLRWEGLNALRIEQSKLSGPPLAVVCAVLLEMMPEARAQIQAWSAKLGPQERRLMIQTRLGLLLARQQTEAALALLAEYHARADLAPSEKNWSQRQLAYLYARQRSEAGRRHAAQLLDQISDDPGASADELRVTAQALATLSRFLEGESRQRALRRTVAALEAAWQKSKAPKDLYDLAQLYRLLGQRAESRRCLQTLLNNDPDNLHFLIAALDELTEAGEQAAAETFAQRLQQRHADDFRAVTALARHWCRTGQAEKARPWVERYLHAAETSTGDYWSRQAQVATLFDELARLPQVRQTPVGLALVQAAAERYTTLVPHQPEAAVGLAGILAYSGQVELAMEQLQRWDNYLSLTTRAAAAVAIARNARLTEVQATQLLQWIDACVQQEPASLTARLYRAEFFALRHDLDQAVREYEAILKDHPHHVIVLNNLAWLLSADPQRADRALQLVNRALEHVGLTGDLLDTRARARISLRQLNEAEQDLLEAIRLEATPLRYFHLAVLHLQHAPPKTAEASEAFARALARGLEERNVHPADLVYFRKLHTLQNTVQR
ncbi:MAG: tetratricopeptide repeat protein [Gemmataceae bacterium]|nr:tetratricopeptide repeat protein [Gemmataceae bacterium]